MSFDFDVAVSAPFRMQPGLRRLAEGAAHLTPLMPGGRHQREKLAVLSAFADQALCTVDGFDPGPALEALARQAAREHPDAWRWDAGRADALRLGTSVDAGGEVHVGQAGAFGLGDEIARCIRPLPPAWRLPALFALAFAEDLAIVDGANGQVPWMAVTLPSHWAPEDKVGRHFTQIHAPVADGDAIRRAADALVALVTGSDRWERFVWNVSAHPRLHAHPRRTPREAWGRGAADALPSSAWWRTERQTFLPVPGQSQALFTIAVDTRPLAEAIDTPDRARRLHQAIASMSPAVLAYRGLAPVRDRLLGWLAARSSVA